MFLLLFRAVYLIWNKLVLMKVGLIKVEGSGMVELASLTSLNFAAPPPPFLIPFPASHVFSTPKAEVLSLTKLH